MADVSTEPQCYMCGARQFSILGTLGNVVWYRCRNCGADVPAACIPELCADVPAADVPELCDCGACDGTGRVTVTDYPCGRRHGFGYCQQFSEPCDSCDGTGIDKGEK
jgi:hypothetical protein